ncbi:type II toxin-antitoxin system MqsA family antitoxin [Pasteurella atlantica]|uniref:helix-turn-helix domain-containing protein n=1 Tax=Pasteurellaceae TaxID=712 RepID=UPI002749B1F7|nr:type II toxin-antitoxin system MqsA family antitoxin [Pasteurella atlantica]MDP8036530.1 type II toxin-antitoxin system MqsA family antitoxin [Pasteurella atlantica]MDP8048814.1 type II toxin-antitoxin system MqsA family antitoxin [Pasteurella atlantica]MDP8060592.1 type II toxin-antitoxin system MqsA family antitoxin [Pasteurella atlantica]MDP8066029.1 type II toxin-antitoxin system MqsA family antitoxin [Pasteurella atlantica]MDP8073834.1 type II toxin-antitoxin system MqsA family antitox
MDINNLNIDSVVKACELDAGQSLPELANALQEMNEGKGVKHSPESILLKSTRTKLTMTQNEFAKLIRTPIGTLRDWEQGRVEPSGVAVTLAGLLNKHPSLVREML